jgi:hypothetical protein
LSVRHHAALAVRNLMLLGAAVGFIVVAPPRAAAAGPQADSFSFLYPSSQSSLDTRAAGDKTYAQLKAMGYNAFDINNVSAATSLNSADGQADAIWTFVGHARPGALLFYNGSALSEVWASTGIPSYGYPATILRSTPNLSDIRLMVFEACETANDVSLSLPDNGNLMNNAYYSRGVDSVVGFRGDLLTAGYVYWSNMFYTNLYQGKTISQAAVNAADYVLVALGIPGGFDTYRVYNGNIKTVPAAYGNWL